MDIVLQTQRNMKAHHLRKLVSLKYSRTGRNYSFITLIFPFSKQTIISKFSDSSDHEHKEQNRNRPDSWRVWLASAGSITVIATCEVFAVLVVPIMQRVFYQHIIQFLIALAIGSLLGNAGMMYD